MGPPSKDEGSPEGDVAKALDSLEISDQAVSIHLADGVVRPQDPCKEGKPIALRVNAFAAKIPDLQIYHYDVVIEAMMKDDDGKVKPAPKDAKKLPNELLMAVFAKAKGEMSALSGAQRVALAFDGRKNAFSPMRLPFTTHSQMVDLESPSAQGRPSRGRLFEVTMKEVHSFSLSSVNQFCRADRKTVQAAGTAMVESVTLALQSLEVALREDRLTQYRVHGAGGRRFFDPATAIPISGGAQIWEGFFQSARATKSGLVVFLDPAYSCFLGGGPFLQLAAEILGVGGPGGGGPASRGRRGGYGGGGHGGGGGGYGGGNRSSQGGAGASLTDITLHQERELRRKLHGVLVRPTHRPNARVEKFKGFTPVSARDYEFDCDGSRISVERYFRTTFNITLRFPLLKCALIGRSAAVPLELLDVIGGNPMGPTHMSPQQVSDMIRISAKKPAERLNRIKQWRRELNYGQNDRIGSWGANVDVEPMQLQGRVLKHATIQYKTSKQQPRNGSWNLINSRFVIPGKPLVNLVVINFTRGQPNQVTGFVNNLLQSLGSLGVDVRRCEPTYQDIAPDMSAGLDKMMLEVGKTAWRASKARLGDGAAPPQLYLCILPEGKVGDDLYKRVKVTCTKELVDRMPSQCVVGSFKKAFGDRGIDKYCANVAMKVNVKLGGCNHTIGAIDLPKVGTNCMMIGVDVGHAPPGSSHPSVVAVVANTNGVNPVFWTEIKAQANARVTGGNQDRSQETITNGTAMYTGVLQAWMAQNANKLPANVIFFRDGVSEGEYRKVVNSEHNQFKVACQNLMTTNANLKMPKVTFIVCTKRHNVRFFAIKSTDEDGRTGNLPSGTVVDTAVVHPYAHDFYLQSQAGLQGTARPGHYIVLRDEIGFTGDEIQRLVFSVCHSYARSTNTVSMPPMTMYAHHAADKARMLLYPSGEFSDTASEVSGGGNDRGSYGIDYASLMDFLGKPPTHRSQVSLNATLWYM